MLEPNPLVMSMLTSRDQALVELLCQGYHAKEIAQQWKIGTSGVKQRESKIFVKLGLIIHSREALVSYVLLPSGHPLRAKSKFDYAIPDVTDGYVIANWLREPQVHPIASQPEDSDIIPKRPA
jgi:DNA-binding CsgD family transcriptional regulator